AFDPDPRLGQVLLRVKSAALTANFSLLLYGFTCGGMLLVLAPVFIVPPVRGLAAVLAFAAFMVIGLILVLACSHTLLRRVDLHEQGVCVRGLLGVRKLHYRDLADIEITPLVVTRRVGFVPVSRRTVLELRFVPQHGTGLKPIVYIAH